MKVTVITVCLAVALSLPACGVGPGVTRRSPPPTTPEAAAIPEAMVKVWSAAGGVSTIDAYGLGEHAVYVVVSRRLEGRRSYETRLHRIDRATGQAISRAVGAEFDLLRVDPIVVNAWDGERARWLGTRIMRLSEELEPMWRSDPMNISPPRSASGPLVIVEQGQVGEYVGLHPDDGRVVFRLRDDPNGIFNYAARRRASSRCRWRNARFSSTAPPVK